MVEMIVLVLFVLWVLFAVMGILWGIFGDCRQDDQWYEDVARFRVTTDGPADETSAEPPTLEAFPDEQRCGFCGRPIHDNEPVVGVPAGGMKLVACVDCCVAENLAPRLQQPQHGQGSRNKRRSSLGVKSPSR